ncbi:VanZ family protein [Streptomyces sp. NBC_01498]|uniref:VanZ family protein n=1 Tax=Streptomyces sp. NBC_01498 TaxID=2975870 RepID=UPI002E7B447F|nr:VanZ family protein [Streptomyces sp. NBC_01498]WTL26216.1 VanZ family protein [Streptomyces sp. NBC_01498]
MGDGAGRGGADWSTSWGGAVLRVVILAVALILLAGFAVVLASLTLTPSPASSEIAGANLRPGHSLRMYAEDYTFLAACKQVGGNVLMGAPFGLLLPVLVPRRFRMLRVIALTAAMMIVVELAQGAVVEGRAFDVDDVIMNTSGAFLAYLLLGRRLSHRFHTLGFRSLEARAQREEERERERVAEKKARRAGVVTDAGGRAPWSERVRSAVRREPATGTRTTARKAAPKETAAKRPFVNRPFVKKAPSVKTTPAKASAKTSTKASAKTTAAQAKAGTKAAPKAKAGSSLAGRFRK